MGSLVLRLLAAAVLLASASTSVSALTISSVTAVANAGNTANFTGTESENLSSVSVVDTGGSAADTLGASVNAATRYAAVVLADRTGSGGGGSAVTRTASSDYRITFQVSAGTGILYDLVIDTSRLGAVTLVTDTGPNVASGSIGAVTGKLNTVTNASLGLAAGPSLSGAGGQNQGFSQSSQLVITGLTGTNNYTLDFTWSATASSNRTEAAVRLGLTGTVTSVTADDYPGVGSRTQTSDGHFVTVTAQVTSLPEPGSVGLLMLGLAGLGAFRARRRS
jgi:hypothetical protein